MDEVIHAENDCKHFQFDRKIIIPLEILNLCKQMSATSYST
jgi:hypothetical protein